MAEQERRPGGHVHASNNRDRRREGGGKETPRRDGAGSGRQARGGGNGSAPAVRHQQFQGWMAQQQDRARVRSRGDAVPQNHAIARISEGQQGQDAGLLMRERLDTTWGRD